MHEFSTRAPTLTQPNIEPEVRAISPPGGPEDLILWATEIKVRAERKCGTMLAESAEHGERATRAGNVNPATRKVSSESTPSVPTLADIGITRDQSSRYQQLASMSDEHFGSGRPGQRHAGRSAGSIPRPLANGRRPWAPPTCCPRRCCRPPSPCRRVHSAEEWNWVPPCRRAHGAKSAPSAAVGLRNAQGIADARGWTVGCDRLCAGAWAA